jgi:hypothetical protein
MFSRKKRNMFFMSVIQPNKVFLTEGQRSTPRPEGARSAMLISFFSYSTLTPWIPFHLIQT